MSEGVSGKYLVRDPQGNVYGPADAEMLRAWVRQGRIVAGMAIAAQETREWVGAAEHPAVADLLRAGTGGVVGQQAIGTAAVPVGTVGLTAAQENPAATIAYALPPRQNVLGLLSLIFGGASIVVACAGICVWPISVPISGLLAIAAITLGCLAISQMRANPAAYSGQGMAVAGIAMGSMMLLLFLVAAVVMIIVFVSHR